MSSLEQLLSECISGVETGSFTDRNREIFKAYYGIGGTGMSMEAVGERHGLTRECVRQILNRFRIGMKETGRPEIAGELEKALRLVEKSLPGSAERMNTLLREAKVAGNDIGVMQILALAAVFGVKTKNVDTTRLGEALVLVKPGSEKLPREIAKQARQEISHNGVVSAKSLATSFGLEGKEGIKLVMDIVGTMPGATWFELSDGSFWGYFGDYGRNRLLNGLNKVFSYVEAAMPEHLQEAMSRFWAKDFKDNSVPPSAEIISALADIDDNFAFDSSKNVITCHNPQRPKKALRPMEYKIAKCISEKSEGNDFVREKELEDTLVKGKQEKRLKDKFSFSMALNHSPLIIRLERGQYALTGTAREA